MSADSRATAERRGVRLSLDDAWRVIEQSHTGILTTLRRDGVPISLPVWFVTLDRRIYVMTPGTAKKVARIRNDARASFLVESGENWAELRAVHFTGRAVIVDDSPELDARVRRAQDEKYAAFRTARRAMPKATSEHYAQRAALICFEPDGHVLSWDNARLFGE